MKGKRTLTLEERISQYCEDCRHAEWDYYEYLDGAKQYFQCGCKKGLEPEYNEEDDDLNCNDHEWEKE